MSDPDGSDFTSLYPFLNEPGPDNELGPDNEPGPDKLRDQIKMRDRIKLRDQMKLRDQACDSSRLKIREIVELRQRVARDDAGRLAACANDIAARLASGGRLFTFGNGGSSTDAQDMARLFMWPGHGRRALPAIALTNDVAAVTALTNDVGFDVAFARQLGAFGRAGDVAVGLSTSGNSPNLLRAFDQAKRMGMCVVGLAGSGGGKMADLPSIDHLFSMPSASVHRTQEAQTTVYHVLWELTVSALTASAISEVTPSGAGLPAQMSPVPSGSPGGDKT